MPKRALIGCQTQHGWSSNIWCLADCNTNIHPQTLMFTISKFGSALLLKLPVKGSWDVSSGLSSIFFDTIEEQCSAVLTSGIQSFGTMFKVSHQCSLGISTERLWSLTPPTFHGYTRSKTTSAKVVPILTQVRFSFSNKVFNIHSFCYFVFLPHFLWSYSF